MCAHVNARNCTRGGGGVTYTRRESALKGDWEKNLLPHQGVRLASAAQQSDAERSELHPCPVHGNSFLVSLVPFVMCGVALCQVVEKNPYANVLGPEDARALTETQMQRELRNTVTVKSILRHSPPNQRTLDYVSSAASSLFSFHPAPEPSPPPS